jgi:hypothetical protein
MRYRSLRSSFGRLVKGVLVKGVLVKPLPSKPLPLKLMPSKLMHAKLLPMKPPKIQARGLLPKVLSPRKTWTRIQARGT